MQVQVLGDALVAPVVKALTESRAELKVHPFTGNVDADVLVYARPLDQEAYQFLRRAKERNPRLRTIVVTAAPVWAEAVQVLRGGAESLAYDYLDAGDMWFNQRLTAVVDDVNILKYGDLEIRLNKKLTLHKGSPLSLTPMETDILAVFLQHPGKGVDYVKITTAVYGETLSTDDARRKTRTHIWSLRKKLRAVYGRDVIVSREQVGYVLAI